MVSESPSSLSQNSKSLLKSGIAAAKAGQRERACTFLRRVVEYDEENIPAWLWLSGVVESLDERRTCLEQVLALDPQNAVARKGLAQIHKERMAKLLREGIAAAKAGQRERASDLLTQVVIEDERNVNAWLWLSGVADEAENRIFCLENVLSLDPDNEVALKGLTQLRREGMAIPEHPQVPVPDDVADVPVEDPLGNPYLCPYCAALTQREDRKCPVCEKKLWINYRAEEERSVYMWSALAVQLVKTLWNAVAPAMLGFVLIFAAENAELLDQLEVVAQFFGTEGEAVLFTVRILFLASLVPFLASLFILIGLYLRWKPIFYLLMIDSGIRLLLVTMSTLVSVVSMNPLMGIVGGGYLDAAVSFALALGSLVLAFLIQDDFAFEEQRVLLQLEKGVSSGPMFFSRAQVYVKRKMWAMAALHMRRAVFEMPDRVEAWAALILMYVELKRYDLAAPALEEGLSKHPGSPELLELQELIPASSAAPV